MNSVIYYLNKGDFTNWNLDQDQDLDNDTKIAYGPDFSYQINVPILKKIYFKGLQEIHILNSDSKISYIEIEPDPILSTVFIKKNVKNSESNSSLDQLEKEDRSEQILDIKKVLDQQSIKDVHKLESATRREEYKKSMNNNKTEKRSNAPSTKKILESSSISKSKSKTKKTVKIIKS